MKKLIVNYNLEILTAVLAIVFGVSLFFWNSLALAGKALLGFMVLYTLHEWEESRFPGGFYRIFFSKCIINPNVSEERMHLPVAVYLLIILLTPFIFDNMVIFALVPLVLALFEGVIHTAGIVIHQLKRPYSPGMITAWIMFAYAILMIRRLNAELELGALEWILGVVLTVVSFFIMETRFMKGVGITIKDFQTNMRNYMLNRIKNR